MQTQTSADVVVIGGGIVGCSLLYHLAKLSCDALLIEGGQLTLGTTWHSAAGVAPVGSSELALKMSLYGMDLYERLEAETGQSTGWRQTGFLEIARTADA